MVRRSYRESHERDQRIISVATCSSRPRTTERSIKIISEVAPLQDRWVGGRIGWDVDAKDQRIPKRGLIGSSSPARVVGPAGGRQDQRMFIGRRMADEALMHDSTLHHCAVDVWALSGVVG